MIKDCGVLVGGRGVDDMDVGEIGVPIGIGDGVEVFVSSVGVATAVITITVAEIGIVAGMLVGGKSWGSNHPPKDGINAITIITIVAIPSHISSFFDINHTFVVVR